MIAVRIALVLFCCTTVVSAQPDFGSLNPAAPPETAQFSFIVGEWACATKFMRPDGEYVEGEAVWMGSYILDGWAIKDVWQRPSADGGTFIGINIRSFNTKTGKWDNRWLSQGDLQWKAFESEMVGDNMVMTGSGEDQRGPFIDRNTFYEIEADSWRWRKDRSWDGGETWVEGIGFIEASRVK